MWFCLLTPICFSEISPLKCFTEEPVSEDYKQRWTGLYRKYLKEGSALYKLEDKEELKIRFRELYQDYKRVRIPASTVHWKLKQAPYGGKCFYWLRAFFSFSLSFLVAGILRGFCACVDPVRSRGVRDEPAEPLGSVRRGPGDIPGGLRARDAPQRGEQVRVRVEGCRPRAVRALPHDARWREGQLPALRPRGRFQEEPPRPALLKCRRSWWLRGSALVVVVLDR